MNNTGFMLHLFTWVNIKEIYGSNYTLTLFLYAVFTVHNATSGRIYTKTQGERLTVLNSLVFEIQIFEYVNTFKSNLY